MFGMSMVKQAVVFQRSQRCVGANRRFGRHIEALDMAHNVTSVLLISAPFGVMMEVGSQ